MNEENLQKQITELKKLIAWVIFIGVSFIVGVGGVLLNQLIDCIEKSL